MSTQAELGLGIKLPNLIPYYFPDGIDVGVRAVDVLQQGAHQPAQVGHAGLAVGRLWRDKGPEGRSRSIFVAILVISLPARWVGSSRITVTDARCASTTSATRKFA